MPPLNKKCKPLVLNDDKDVKALLASQSDSSCKIPLGVIVETIEVYTEKKSEEKSNDETDGSNDEFH